MKSVIDVAIIGMGGRGWDAYGRALKQLTDRARIVAIADLDPKKRQEAGKELGVAEEFRFASAEEMLQRDRLADVMLVCSQDQQHVGHAIPAMEKGYHILMEKPISPYPEECKRLLEVARRTGSKVAVGHVLRYSPFYRKIKEIIGSGILGELMVVQGIENVAYWHQAHSYVRGNWRDSRTSSPMLLAKCCHDMDLMVWLTGRRCRRVSSFGSLGHFTPEHAPEGAGMRCLECGAKEDCPYDAEKIYIYNKGTGVACGNTSWPCNILDIHPTEESIRKALETGPYGRCVYHCDNNVVDHQVVNLDMEGGLTVNFTMSGFTGELGRYTKYMGTKGSMIGDLEAGIIHVTPFGRETVTYDFNQEGMSGHGGGDTVFVKEFLDYIQGAQPEGITTLEESLESHFIAFAAEESRLAGGQCVEIRR